MSLPSTIAPDMGPFGTGPSSTGPSSTGPSSTTERATAHLALDSGDLPVHLAVTTVLMKCPHPLSAIEVAVVLETCGYSPGRVRATGAADLMELARAVYALVPVYAQGQASTADDITDEPDSAQGHAGLALEAAGSFCKGLVFSAPLLVSLSTMLVAGVSFWSSKVELRSIASSVTMSACLALIFTGPFIQAFGRRASFYLGLGDNGMLAYLTKRVLGTGMIVAFLACFAAYFIRTHLAAGGAPAANRLGLATGLAIAALQLGLAPFYLRNAMIPMMVIVGGAGAVLAWHATHLGAYIDPVNLAVWQVRLVASMAALAWVVDGWWLLRSPEARHRTGAERRLWKPSGAAVARAVAPYGAFGLAYFCLVSLPQLISGGAWSGRYGFNPEFSLASGMALVGLLPVAGFGAVAADRITRHVLPATLDRERIGSVARAYGAEASLADAVVVGGRGRRRRGCDGGPGPACCRAQLVGVPRDGCAPRAPVRVQHGLFLLLDSHFRVPVVVWPRLARPRRRERLRGHGGASRMLGRPQPVRSHVVGGRRRRRLRGGQRRVRRSRSGLG